MAYEQNGSAKLAYTMSQLPAATGIASRSFWYRAVRGGGLRARRMGPRKTVVLHSDLISFLQNLPSLKEASGAAK